MNDLNTFKVTVFGGASPLPGEPSYDEALLLGRLIGKQGWTVLTGGYIGTMEAVSRGAAEGGSHVIGVTCMDIENWRNTKVNPWVHEERKFATLRERMLALIDFCDAAVALPGGIGTLTEIMMTWNQLLIHTIPPRPLVMIGVGWKKIFSTFYKEFNNYIPYDQRQWAAFATDPHQAILMLQEFHAGGKV